MTDRLGVQPVLSGYAINETMTSENWIKFLVSFVPPFCNTWKIKSQDFAAWRYLFINLCCTKVIQTLGTDRHDLLMFFGFYQRSHIPYDHLSACS